MALPDVLTPCVLAVEVLTAVKVLVTACLFLKEQIRSGQVFQLWCAATQWFCKQRAPNDAESEKMDKRSALAFEQAQSRMLMKGLHLFMIFGLAKFIYMQHGSGQVLAGSQELALTLVGLVALTLAVTLTTFQFLVSPRTLDAWFVTLQTAFVYPMIFMNFTSTAELATFSLRTFPARALCGVAAKHLWVALVGNFLHMLLALRAARRIGEAAKGSVGLELFHFLILVLFTCLMRYVLFKATFLDVNLKAKTIELQTVSSLLCGFCDAVVEVDGGLKLTQDCRQLSTMLLRGITSQDLVGSDLLEFFCAEDRDHVRECLSSGHGAGHPLALNARMLDSMGNRLNIELLHMPFECDDKQYRLIGMREFQDGAPPGPLRQSRVDPMEPRLTEGAEASLVFDALSLTLLMATPEMERVHRDIRGCDMGRSLASVLHLRDESPDLVAQIQDHVNSFRQEAPLSRDLGQRRLWRRLDARVKVTLEHDVCLETLVGTLVLVPVSGVPHHSPFVQPRDHPISALSSRRLQGRSGGAGQLRASSAPGSIARSLSASETGEPRCLRHHSCGTLRL